MQQKFSLSAAEQQKIEEILHESKAGSNKWLIAQVLLMRNVGVKYSQISALFSISASMAQYIVRRYQKEGLFVTFNKTEITAKDNVSDLQKAVQESSLTDTQESISDTQENLSVSFAQSLELAQPLNNFVAEDTNIPTQVESEEATFEQKAENVTSDKQDNATSPKCNKAQITGFTPSVGVFGVFCGLVASPSKVLSNKESTLADNAIENNQATNIPHKGVELRKFHHNKCSIASTLSNTLGYLLGRGKEQHVDSNNLEQVDTAKATKTEAVFNPHAALYEEEVSTKVESSLKSSIFSSVSSLPLIDLNKKPAFLDTPSVEHDMQRSMASFDQDVSHNMAILEQNMPQEHMLQESYTQSGDTSPSVRKTLGTYLHSATQIFSGDPKINAPKIPTLKMPKPSMPNFQEPRLFAEQSNPQNSVYLNQANIVEQVHNNEFLSQGNSFNEFYSNADLMSRYQNFMQHETEHTVDSRGNPYRYMVRLDEQQRKYLEDIVSDEFAKAKDYARWLKCKILLLSAQGKSNSEIAQQLQVDPSRISRVRSTFVRFGMNKLLNFNDDVLSISVYRNQVKQLIFQLLLRSPQDFGYKNTLWTGTLLQDYLWQHCDELKMPDLLNVQSNYILRLITQLVKEHPNANFFIRKREVQAKQDNFEQQEDDVLSNWSGSKQES